MSDDIEQRLDRLESLVDDQQEIIESQRERIAELAEGDGGGTATDNEQGSDDCAAVLNRRSALKAGGLLALLFGGAGTASADPQGQVGTSGDPLQALYTEALNGGVTGDTTLTSLTGPGLTVSGSRLGFAGTEDDTANTFTEYGVTVTHSKTKVANGAIELYGSVSRPQDNNTSTVSQKAGIEIEPQADLSSITATISSMTNSESTVYILNGSGTQLASEPSPGAGNSVTLTASLSAGTKYYIVVDAGGSDYTLGRRASVSFPYTSSKVDITAGANGTSAVNDTAYAISKLEYDVQSGSATVAFSRPTSVDHWRSATFQDEPDSETVEVYVETSSDDGSTWSDWQSKPIGPGTDLSTIPASDYVRFRVELSRADLTNNPRLRLLSRQYSP